MTELILIIVNLCILLWIACRLLSKRSSMPCPAWLSWMVERDNPFTKVTRAEAIIQHLALHKDMTILDIGCGPGRLTIPIAKQISKNGKIVAMDIQDAMLNKVRKKADDTNLNNIIYLNANIANCELENNKFDRILLVSVLGEIPSQDQGIAVKKIFNALKPGGILSVTETIFDPHFHRCATVLKLASMAGFQKKDFFGNCVAYTLNLEKEI